MPTVDDVVNGGRSMISAYCPKCRAALNTCGVCITCDSKANHTVECQSVVLDAHGDEVCPGCSAPPPYASRVCPYCGVRFTRRTLDQHERTPVVSDRLHCDRCKSPRVDGGHFCFTCGKEFCESKAPVHASREAAFELTRTGDHSERLQVIEARQAPSEALFQKGNLVLKPGRLMSEPIPVEVPHCPECDRVPPYAARLCPYCSHRFERRVLVQTPLTPMAVEGQCCNRCKSPVVVGARICFTCANEFPSPIEPARDIRIDQVLEEGEVMRIHTVQTSPLQALSVCFAVLALVGLCVMVLAFVHG